MTTVVGIDPGPTTSGFVLFDGSRVVEANPAYENEYLRRAITRADFPGAAIVIERIQFYGRIQSVQVLDTLWWSGRFYEAAIGAGYMPHRTYWSEVKRQFVPAARRDETGKRKKVTEADVRLGVEARFGGRKSAVGIKRAPGPCYGVTSHAWSALALAIYWWDRSASAGLVPPMAWAAPPAAETLEF